MAEASAYQKFNEAAEVSAFPKFNDTDKLSGEEDPSFHPGNPYVHKPGQDNGGLIKLVDVLHNNLRGGRLNYTFESRNLYLALGGAEQENEKNWDFVRAALKSWCDRNDARHPRGWVLLTQGKGEVGSKTARFVADRGIPVVALCNDYDFCEPGEPRWPAFASAVFFGVGARHGSGKQCRRGYAMDPGGNRIGHAFPDAAMFEHEIEDDGAVRLVDLVEGVFVSGTDRATKDQIEMYGVGQREADEIVGPLRLTGFNPRKTPTGGIF